MPVQDYLYSQFINVTDYGARPDGTDSSTAFQQAIDAAEGRPIFIPAGTFSLLSPLVVTAPSDDHASAPKFLGEGQDISVLDYKGASTFFTCNQTVGYKFLKDGLFTNLTTSGKSTNVNQHAFGLTGAWDWFFEKVKIVNFGGDAIRSPLTSSVVTTLTQVVKTEGSNQLTRATGGFLTILRVGDGVSGVGIPLGTIVTKIVSDFTINISAPVTITQTSSIDVVGNTDAIQSIIHLRDTSIFNNKGYALAGYSGLGLITNWKNTKAQNNGGGILLGATCDIDGGVIANNGFDLRTPGIRFTKISGIPQNVSIRKIEFDGNYDTHAKLEYATNATIDQCRFISHLNQSTSTVTMNPPRAIYIGGALNAASVKNLTVNQCAFRVDAQGGISYEAIVLGDTGTYSDINITEPNWITLTGPNQKKINKTPHPDASFRMIESGKMIYGNPVATGYALSRLTYQVVLPPVAETTIPFNNVVRGDGTIIDIGIPYSGLWTFDVSISLSNVLVNETGTLTFKVGSVSRTINWNSNGQTSIILQHSFSVVLTQSNAKPEIKLRRNGGNATFAKVNFNNDATTLLARFVN